MILFDILYVCLVALIAAGLGTAFLRLFRDLPEALTDLLALALPLGLGALGLVTLLLGELGLLNARAIAVTTALLGLIAAPGLNFLVRRHAPNLRVRPQITVFDVFLAIVVASTFFTSLTPVTDGDALCYHLQVPKVFLNWGSVGFDPNLHETIYPLLTELLYADALALRSPVACRLIQWLMGLVFALSVTAIARPMLGHRARWAGTIALLVPAVSNGMGAPLNDVALAAFGNAAIFAWTRWQDKQTARRAALAGIVLGLALGVKYPALVLGGLIGLAMIATLAFQALRDRGSARKPSADAGGGKSWAIRHIKDRFYIDPRDVMTFQRKVGPFAKPTRRGHWTHPLLFGALAFLVGCCWYMRAYHYTGNPVFPFFRQVFGGAGLDEVLDPLKKPLPVTVWNVLTALGPMTLEPARFDSFAHQFGPIFLLILPALLIERPGKAVWRIIAIGYLFLTLCITQRQSMRFVLIAVGPLSVGAAWIAAKWWDRRTVPSRVLILGLLICLGLEATIAASRTRHGLSVVLGRETQAEYLARKEPTYRVGQWIDANLSPNAKLVGQDHRGFYIPRDYAMELAYRRRTGLGTHEENASTITDSLRRDGFTHVLLCPPEPETAVEFDPTLSHKLASWTANRAPLYQQAITDPDGVTRRYTIYDLTDGPAQFGTTARVVR